jgi:hypothetical protein
MNDWFKNFFKVFITILAGMLIAAVIVAAIMFIVRTTPAVSTSTTTSIDFDEYIDLVEISSKKASNIVNGRYVIYYDKNTGVMYLETSVSNVQSGITPILNTDGTPKIYEGWNSK